MSKVVVCALYKFVQLDNYQELRDPLRLLLEEQGVEVVERIALETGSNPHNEKYLSTKAGKLGHMMEGHG